MKRVILESPFKATELHHVERNKRYLNAAIRDCIRRGESPYASHRMLTEALDDNDPDERRTGIEAGFAWAFAADYVVVYGDLGISEGMRLGILRHRKNGMRIEERSLPEWRTEAAHG